jgi:hypothetical protein
MHKMVQEYELYEIKLLKKSNDDQNSCDYKGNQAMTVELLKVSNKR